MIWKIRNTENLSLKDLETAIQQGARFKVFAYRIGVVKFNFLRLSPAILIRHKEEEKRYKSKYNRLNLFLDPWSLFMGPTYTYRTWKDNRNGGIDVTGDIMLNLKEENLQEQKVEIERVHHLFKKMDKTDLKALKKAMQKVDPNSIGIQAAYAGVFVNVGDYEEPPFTIGFEGFRNQELDEEKLRNALRKYFYSKVQFWIFNLKDEPELAGPLKEQGEKVW